MAQSTWNKFERWVDSRMAIFTLMREHAIDYPTPKNLNYFWNYGSLALFALVSMMPVMIMITSANRANEPKFQK